MRGDKIVIEAHHRRAGNHIVDMLLSQITATKGKYTITVAGESGSGKSETATAIAEALEAQGLQSIILQQDDYYIYPPKTNDQTRRNDIRWVGTNEVKLDVLDQNLRDFLDGKDLLEKPLVIYDEDRITTETVPVDEAKVAIAEGTYTTLLNHVNTRVFINRNRLETRAHREKRGRSVEELDQFTEDVLKIEHEIIAPHRERADIIITNDYEVEAKS
jgi:uridine kinase